jgi:hypothetical protein
MKELCLSVQIRVRLVAEARGTSSWLDIREIGVRDGILIRNPLIFFCYDKDIVIPQLFL